MANWCTPCTVGYTVVERYTLHHNDNMYITIILNLLQTIVTCTFFFFFLAGLHRNSWLYGYALNLLLLLLFLKCTTEQCVLSSNLQELVLLCVGLNTVECRYNEVPWTGKNLLTITRFCYIEVLSHNYILLLLGKEDHSLYWGLHYIEVCYIKVPL